MKKVDWSYNNDKFAELSKESQMNTSGGGIIPDWFDIVMWMIDLGTIKATAPTVDSYPNSCY